MFFSEYPQCGSNKIGTSSTFSFFMCKLGENISKYGKFCQSFKRVKVHYGDPLWDTFGFSIIIHTI
jgi:hypothetical protein